MKNTGASTMPAADVYRAAINLPFTDVATISLAGSVDIKANKLATREFVDLTIRNYQPGNHTYTIDNQHPRYNLNSSLAYYADRNTTIQAATGKIVVSSFTANTISGSFSFTNHFHGTISGTFIAPAP